MPRHDGVAQDTSQALIVQPNVPETSSVLGHRSVYVVVLDQGFYEQLLLYAVRQAETAARAGARQVVVVVVASHSSSS